MTKSLPFLLLARVVIGGVWIFHGAFSKLADGIPRHRQIVGRILGESLASPATTAVGILEILLGLWAFTAWRKVPCAVVQTLAIAGMNTLEILLARQLLISAPGMVALNLCFLGFVWWWALSREAIGGIPPGSDRSR